MNDATTLPVNLAILNVLDLLADGDQGVAEAIQLRLHAIEFLLNKCACAKKHKARGLDHKGKADPQATE